MDRDLAAAMSRLRSELSTVDETQALKRQEPQPQERRHHVGLPHAFGTSLRCLDKGVLDDIRRVNPSAQSLIESQRDHSP